MIYRTRRIMLRYQQEEYVVPGITGTGALLLTRYRTGIIAFGKVP